MELTCLAILVSTLLANQPTYYLRFVLILDVESVPALSG